MKKIITYVFWFITAFSICYASLNIVDNIVATGMLRQWNIRHAFGWFQLQNTTLNITTQSWWVHITNASGNLWTGQEVDWFILSGDVIKTLNNWDYFWQLTISVSWPTNNDICIRLWNITQSKQEWDFICWTTTSASNFMPLSMPLYIEDDANDEFRMEIANISANQDVAVRSAVFFLSYLHD